MNAASSADSAPVAKESKIATQIEQIERIVKARHVKHYYRSLRRLKMPCTEEQLTRHKIMVRITLLDSVGRPSVNQEASECAASTCSYAIAVAPSIMGASEKPDPKWGTVAGEILQSVLSSRSRSAPDDFGAEASVRAGAGDDPQVPAGGDPASPTNADCDEEGGLDRTMQTKEQLLQQLSSTLVPAGAASAAVALAELAAKLSEFECESESFRSVSLAWYHAAASTGQLQHMSQYAAFLDSNGLFEAGARVWRKMVLRQDCLGAALWQAGQAMLLGQGGTQQLAEGIQTIARAMYKRHDGAFSMLRHIPEGDDLDDHYVAARHAFRVCLSFGVQAKNQLQQASIRGTHLEWLEACSDLTACGEVYSLGLAHWEAHEGDKSRARDLMATAAAMGHAEATQWLGRNMQCSFVRNAVKKHTPVTDGSANALDSFMQRCVRAATQAGSADGDAAYGGLVQRRLQEALIGPDLRAVRELATAATLDGSSYAALQLASICEHGIGGPVQLADAKAHLEAAAAKENIIAQHILAHQRDTAQAVFELAQKLLADPACPPEVTTHWLTKAHLAGNLKAKVVLGEQLSAKDREQDAKALYEEVEAGKDAEALFDLAIVYFKEHRKWSSYKAALLVQRSAQSKYLPAMLCMGKIFDSGSLGLPGDTGKAAEWFKAAADAGSGKAMFETAKRLESEDIRRRLHYTREGVEPARAVWMLKAAEAGYVPAMFEYAELLKSPEFAPCYPAGYTPSRSAIDWYCAAATAGHVQAAVEAGHGYLNGIWGPKSQLRAAMFYSMAAAKGNASARTSLRDLLLASTDNPQVQALARTGLRASKSVQRESCRS